jgi:hypothetical protein
MISRGSGPVPAFLGVGRGNLGRASRSEARTSRLPPPIEGGHSVLSLGDGAGHGFVCVQSLAVHKAREGDDYIRDKTDHRDAYLIGKPVIRLDCYQPEREDEGWRGCGTWARGGPHRSRT